MDNIKRTNNDVQHTTQKTKDRQATITPLQSWGELACPGRLRSSCSTYGTRRATIVTNPVIKCAYSMLLFTKNRNMEQIYKIYR